MGLSEIILGAITSIVLPAILSATLGVYVGIIASAVFLISGIVGIISNLGELASGITLGGILALFLNLIFL